MKIIVAGGRDFQPTDAHVNLICALLVNNDCTEVVSGGARGADDFGLSLIHI